MKFPCPGCNEERPLRAINKGYSINPHGACAGGKVSSRDAILHARAVADEAKREADEAMRAVDQAAKAAKPPRKRKYKRRPVPTPAEMAERHPLACLRMARRAGASDEYIVLMLCARIQAVKRERHGESGIGLALTRYRGKAKVEITCPDVSSTATGSTTVEALELMAKHLGAIK